MLLSVMLMLTLAALGSHYSLKAKQLAPVPVLAQ